ncbi:MAG: hypothetical protein WBV94_11600 [Blastocatellia bacterium]
MRETLPAYIVRARNTAVESENKIHDDRVAASYGFRGGLVPGVTVYGYMTAPIVERFGRAWLERGSMQVKFHQPFYEDEQVLVHAEVDGDAEPIKVAVKAEREDRTACATGLATINDDSAWLGEARLEDYAEREPPAIDRRPFASRESIVPGSMLGTLREKLDLKDTRLIESMGERLPIYYGAEPLAHPVILLSLANQIMMRNFVLGPWIHAASDLINHSSAFDGEEIRVRGRIRDRYERKGHEFVTIDLLLVADNSRIVQQVRHTAIYRPRAKN